tara:strand:- start:940 stop:1689 length:750 start_codon:yes stop_codon:yes gene_type:complete
MELSNTNFDNVKVDIKNNTVYKFIKLKNNYDKKQFESLKNYIFYISKEIDFLPNVKIYENREYEAVIGANFIKNINCFYNLLENRYAFTNNDLKNFYFFVDGLINLNFLNVSNSIFKRNDFMICFRSRGDHVNFLKKVFLDKNNKIWLLPNYNDIKILTTEEWIKHYAIDQKDYINNSLNYIFRKVHQDRLIKTKEDDVKNIKSQLQNTVKEQSKLIIELQNDRIKFSQVQKILGDKLFTQYFGDNDDI